MHPLQRRAVLGLIVMIESALQQIRSFIALEPGESPVAAPRPISHQGLGDHGQYLNDEEEEQLEQALEAERQAIQREEATRVAKLWGEE